jgi:hypothetical protein
MRLGDTAAAVGRGLFAGAAGKVHHARYAAPTGLAFAALDRSE